MATGHGHFRTSQGCFGAAGHVPQDQPTKGGDREDADLGGGDVAQESKKYLPSFLAQHRFQSLAIAVMTSRLIHVLGNTKAPVAS